MALTRSLDEGVLSVTLARPERANALDRRTIAELAEAFAAAAADSAVRSVLLGGEGDNFCAGADLADMRDSGSRPAEENRADALALAEMLRAAWGLPKPLVAAVRGACCGGGAGLACVADACVADETAWVRFSEARLGLEPSTISPYVVRAIGARQARRLFVTAQRLAAEEARAAGIFHEVVAAGAAADAARELCLRCAANGPAAMASAKGLPEAVAGLPVGAELSAMTAGRLASIRATEEAAEGVRAFLEKRPPRWAGKGG